MSDTPRTDAAEASALEVGQWHLAKLCRELERENAALKEQIAKFGDPAHLHSHCLRYLTDAQVAHLFGGRMTEIQNDREWLRAENATLRDALIRLRDCDWVITLHDRMDAVRKIARDALANRSKLEELKRENAARKQAQP